MKYRGIGLMLVLALAFALVPGVAIAAPAITQGIQGVVTDQLTGVPIPFAGISVDPTGAPAAVFVMADYDGTYSLSTDVGTFTVDAWGGDSHETSSVADVLVATATVTTQNFSLTRSPDFSQPVYRFFNMKGGVHFYTANDAEFISVYKNLPQFKYDGVAYWIAQGADIAPEIGVPGLTNHNTVPLHRFFNKKTGVHFYTKDVAEMNNVKNNLTAIYTYEGVAYNVSNDSAWGEPVFRFYNPARNAHFYTLNTAEIFGPAKLSDNYRFEGTGFYTGGWEQIPMLPE